MSETECSICLGMFIVFTVVFTNLDLIIHRLDSTFFSRNAFLPKVHLDFAVGAKKSIEYITSNKLDERWHFRKIKVLIPSLCRSSSI